MAIFGLGDAAPTSVKDNKKSKKDSKGSAKKSGKDDSSNADEAKALLEKMSAKADADECPFC